MRKEIEQLQGRLYVRETIIDALVMDESSDLVLQQLRDKVPLEEIADEVYKLFPSLRIRPPPPREETRSSETDYGLYEARASEHWKAHPPDLGSSVKPWKGAGYIPHPQESIEEDQPEQAMQGVDTQWTKVSSDKAMIEHMFALYFCWEYPIFQTLSREQFLSDLRTGTHRYCSHLLVNAMLALGCRLSVQQDSQSNPDDESTAAGRFFAEAKRLLAEKRPPMLPAVQALCLMSLYEASCGRDSESWFFSCQSIQMAIEMGLHTEMPIHDQLAAVEQEVRTATFWGAFSLHQSVYPPAYPLCMC
jgi:Fungal specific transcription factor domain